MARRKVPSQVSTGAETFSDSLVGTQITDGTSQLTNTNFALDKVIPQKDNKNFKTTAFSEFFSLDDLKEEEKTNTTQTGGGSKKDNDLRFRGDRSDAGKSLFGSLKSRLSASLSQIIQKYPAAIYVDPTRPTSVSGLTAHNISYNIQTKITTFSIEAGMFYNPFDVSYITPQGNGGMTETDNSLRNFYSSYKKYVIDISGVTYDILEYYEPNASNIVSFKVSGKPFNVTGSTTTQGYLIRPNDGLNEEFYKGLDELEELLLNRDTNPKYTATFKVAKDIEQGSKTSFVDVEVSWPVDRDNWNLKITGLDYDVYLKKLVDVADAIDLYKSNLFVRFMSSPQLFEFDSQDQKAEAVFQLYGQSFDKVKKYIDNIAYMRNVSYDGIKNLPDVLLKNLANNLGLNTINLFDEKSLDEILYSKSTLQYSGLTFGKSLVDAEYEFYRRLLVNLAYIYKSKGTKSSIQFFLRFLGAPEPMIRVDEYIYRITSFPKSFDIDSDIRDLIQGNKEYKSAIFLPTGGTINGVSYPAYSYYTGVTGSSTSFSRTMYPVEESTALPRKVEDLDNDLFFQMGSGWYDSTLTHRSPDILDVDNSITTGRVKTLLTKSSPYTYGEDYFDMYRNLPGLDTGYELENRVDNSQSQLVSYDSDLIFNRKNISVYLSSARAVDYDIYRKSKDLELNFGTNDVLPVQSAVTFAEFISLSATKLIKNSNTIKYRKNYIVLEDVYRDYFSQTSFTPYNLPDVQEFINRMGPYWTQVLDQIIPSTTLWTGGNIIENNVLGRPKYQYRFGCQPKIIVEDLYPDFETAIEEDLETLLGADEDNFRGLIKISTVTYTPMIEIDGIIYTGNTITVSGTTSTTNSAKLFNPFPFTGCSNNITNNSTTEFPLICEYKNYVDPDITKIKDLWVDSLTDLIDNVINTAVTGYTAGYYDYGPFTAITSGVTHNIEYKPKIKYEFFIDDDGIEKIRFISIKYGPNDCSLNNLDYRFDAEYVPVDPVCDLQVEVYPLCDIYTGSTDCLLQTDLVLSITGITVQSGSTGGLGVYVYQNCDYDNVFDSFYILQDPSGDNILTESNFLLEYEHTGSTVTGMTILPISGQTCLLKIPNYKECDVLDLLFTDAANCDVKLKIQGLNWRSVTGSTIPTTGFTIYPKLQYRNSYNHGLKHDSKVFVVNGATIDSGTTSDDIQTYVGNGSLIETYVQNLSSGDTILSGLYLPCSGFSNQDYQYAHNNNDYSFSYEYSAVTISQIDCLGSVKKSVVSGRTKNNIIEVFEVLPTTRFRVYTNIEVDETTGETIKRKGRFFDSRLPEYLQIAVDLPEPCCDHNEDYYQKGDYLINQYGELLEVVGVDLNYCESNLYFNINLTGEEPDTLVVFNGNGSHNLLLQHTYEEFELFDANLEAYNVLCPVTGVTRPCTGTTCSSIAEPCPTSFPIITPSPTATPTPTSTTTSTPTPTSTEGGETCYILTDPDGDYILDENNNYLIYEQCEATPTPSPTNSEEFETFRILDDPDSDPITDENNDYINYENP